jgi:o-succinylbenzoate synthase
MIIKEAKYFPFTLYFKTPFTNSYCTLTERKGFILKLIDELGNIGYGECSPLPGFSLESLIEAEEALKEAIVLMKQMNFTDSLSIQNIISSVNFSAEQALLNLAFQRNKSLWINKLGLTDKSVMVNAVIGFDDYSAIFDKIETKIESGFTTFKIKVGRENPYEDFELLETIRNNFGFGIKLRIDANRKWSADEAIEFLERFKDFEIEYAEEPCEFTCSTFKTAEETHVPVALDESLKTFKDAEAYIHNCNADFLVIKPMITGGIFSTIKIIELAEQAGKKVIISSSFESAVGKSALVLLASLTNHSFAHGLDTSDHFDKDLCNDHYPVYDGNIVFIANEYPSKINLTY